MGEFGDMGKKEGIFSKLNAAAVQMHREAQEHPLNVVLGTLETCEMKNSANFTATNVARIRLVHLCWNTYTVHVGKRLLTERLGVM